MTATPFDGSGPMWPRALRRWRSRGTVQLCLLGTGMLLRDCQDIVRLGLVRPTHMERVLRLSSHLTQIGLRA